MIVREDFEDAGDDDGLFSGWDPETRSYDTSTWQYEGAEVAAASGNRDQWEAVPGSTAAGGAGGSGDSHRVTHLLGQSESAGSGGASFRGEPERDDTLQHPRCVYQVLTRHFARYTPEMVSRVCGMSPEQFTQVAEAICANSGPRAHHDVGLLGGLDPAHRRRAVHPRRVDPAGTARQHRPPRRRDHGAARPRHDPGLHRHPDALRPAARVHPHAERAQGDAPAGVPGRRRGAEGLLGQHARLRDQPAQGLVRRRGDGRERLLLRPPAPHLRRPLDVHHRPQDDRRRVRGLLRARGEPGGGDDELQAAAPRPGGPALARRARPAGDRDRHLLEERPRDRDRGDADRGHRHRGVPAPRGDAHREGRLVHQHPAPAAVAPPGRRAAGGRAQRPVVRPRAGPPDPGPARGLRPRARRGDPGPHLGLPDRGTPRRPGRPRGPRRDLRIPRRRRQPGRRLHRPARRRVHGLRLLDLLRRVRATGSTRRPGACRPAGRAPRRWSGAGRGR